VATLKRYRIYRQATVLQFKDVNAPVGAHDDAILEVGDGTAWETAAVYEVHSQDIEEQ
jgi:hypothetical protein